MSVARLARFRLTKDPIEIDELRRMLADRGCGAVVGFEGIVRNHHGGRAVIGLRYEAYAELAETEGQAVLEEALDRFPVYGIVSDHRIGELAIGDIAVYVGVAAAHRDAAFAACRFVIDEIKSRVPIWKHECYADGDRAWIHPE